LTFAFEVIAHENTHADPRVRCELVAAIARASGAHGMVGGQMIDLDAEERAVGLDLNGITRLQQLKTGALIAFGCEAGGILGKAADPARLSLKAYAHDVGLAFQIADDILDVESTPEALGKATQKDKAMGKATFVDLLGMDEAKKRAAELVDEAVEISHYQYQQSVCDNLSSVSACESVTMVRDKEVERVDGDQLCTKAHTEHRLPTCLRKIHEFHDLLQLYWSSRDLAN
jgi:farnesyl diphosphate synthase